MDIVSFFLVCLKVVLLSFGGLAALPLLEDELVRQRGVLTPEQFAMAVAVGRITPGPNGLFVLVVGYYVAGVSGALAAMAALCIPALFALVLLRAHDRFAHVAAVQAATRGVVVGSMGLMAAVGVSLLNRTATSPLDYALAGAAFLLMVVARIDAVVVLLGSALVGVALSVVGLW
ncbi:MAG TPA: chromate transporter [Chloroflexota bacterium]